MPLELIKQEVIPSLSKVIPIIVSTSFASISLIIQLSNLNGFIFVGFGDEFSSPPTVYQLRKGLDGTNRPLLSFSARYSLKGFQQGYAFNGLQLDNRYRIFYMASSLDPSINSFYSEVFIKDVKTKNYFDLVKDKKTLFAILFGIFLMVIFPALLLLLIYFKTNFKEIFLRCHFPKLTFFQTEIKKFSNENINKENEESEINLNSSLKFLENNLNSNILESKEMPYFGNFQIFN